MSFLLIGIQGSHMSAFSFSSQFGKVLSLVKVICETN